MDLEHGLALRPDCTLGDLINHLNGSYQLEAGDAECKKWVMLDTFEWSVWHAGMVLFQVGNSLEVFERHAEWIGNHLGSVPVARYARDFSASPITERLAAAIKIRKLQPLLEFGVVKQPIEVRNASDKLILRMEWAVLSWDEAVSAKIQVLQFFPLRGYDAEASAIREALAPVHSSSGEGPLAVLMRAKGLEPRLYTLRTSCAFEGTTSARSAVLELAGKVLAMAIENEVGVIEDIDTEFLHDYRICLRKVRSVLTLIKGIFPEKDVLWLKNELGRMARETNQLRDLDVYLLSQPEYEKRLPEALRPGIAELFDSFAQAREEEQSRVAKHLTSKEYLKQRKKIEDYFTKAEAIPATVDSKSPIEAVAAERISKRYRRILKAGRAMTDETPDAVIHELRIECKRLRYLLEFFSDIFPDPEIRKLEKQLRKLQNRLGLFNDLSIQQAALIKHVRSRPQEADSKMVFAVGALVGNLYTEQGQQRKGILEALNQFCAPSLASEVKTYFQAKFTPPTEENSHP